MQECFLLFLALVFQNLIGGAFDVSTFARPLRSAHLRYGLGNTSLFRMLSPIVAAVSDEIAPAIAAISPGE
jgi:hypothetical protein